MYLLPKAVYDPVTKKTDGSSFFSRKKESSQLILLLPWNDVLINQSKGIHLRSSSDYNAIKI
jgi:hypothetical protein